MGPPPFGSGNHHHRIPRHRHPVCFNGATAFRQWKLEDLLSLWGEGMTLQWGHRLSAVETRPAPPAIFGLLDQLQWGHRLSAVETLREGNLMPDIFGASMGPPPFGSGNGHRAVLHDRRDQASMGPPPFGSGNCAARRTMNPSRTRLQWGHRLSAVETSGTAARRMIWPRFNGATAFRQWKLDAR